MDGWGAASAGPEAASTTDLASPLAEPGQTAAEEALAEQVAFWVSENLQNAELTVTHDGKPVEVSVSMSGKEAHIVFGSDQSETRDLLDASMAQLRDLLHSEGLILSGVTVGESGARNANADGSSDTPRGRQGARQAQVLAPVAETRAPRAQILTDRAVDVFV
ncbi:MAG: flagellar hook-length control protein FliK [Giesbergeria sp.]|nr:flagellar hook-length control protein FliK [Giesbergeria sp.]